MKGLYFSGRKQIPDERGKIQLMMSEDDLFFNRFGQIYFSWIYPGVVKGWHKHHKKTLNYVCIVGMVKLVVYNEETEEIREAYIGEDNYLLVTIEPGLWNGFMNIGTKTAIVANCATMPYSEEDIVRLDPHNNNIPYKWARRDGRT
jgi:dTDP-4-dehydrorhamnose 3,5-epimerase